MKTRRVWLTHPQLKVYPLLWRKLTRGKSVTNGLKNKGGLPMFSGKRIVLGVTGGIAAYKAVELCRLFVRAGAQVRVIMTDAAKEFITPLTFQTVSGNRVYDSLFAATGYYSVDHVGLAKEAEIIVIAPATANCIGKIAGGIADDLLTTTVMAARCPIVLALAMNTGMYENPLTQANIQKLSTLGYIIVEPEVGELACKETGRGRMAPLETIMAAAKDRLFPCRDWTGIRLLITAGPTREAIDPVRYLSNHSSGKMGYAVARAASEMGADVTLISGPVNLRPPAGVEVVYVNSAREMHQEVLQRFPQSDVVIKAAAVADYRPENPRQKKIKKSGDMNLALVRNPDILAELGSIKDKQVLVGFAAETDNMAQNATEKLSRKNLDMIVANDLTMDGAGFNSDTNVVTLFFVDGSYRQLPQMAKIDVAREILAAALQIREIRNSQ
jgi:phosphopantothenoylcysteine decarboxylase / phosphopantothenate---cysteine ligase